MSLRTTLGAEQNLFDETPEHCHQLQLDRPDPDQRRAAGDQAISTTAGLRSTRCGTLFDVARAGEGLRAAIDELCARRRAGDRPAATPSWCCSDRKHDRTLAPIPSLLATSAVHHHLIRTGKRTRCGLVVESGEPREVQHFCLLLGYGAGAINPYLAFEIIHSQGQQELLRKRRRRAAINNYLKACDKGMLKVMSKMGISHAAELSRSADLRGHRSEQ